MNNLKIIVCTTFRDFKGTKNDEIQREFLKSLENQTYTNFELVVTLFGEKNVRNELEKFKLDAYFYDSHVEKEHRYSLTKVILNTIEHAKNEPDGYILFWSTCDVIYEDTFLETIIQNYRMNSMGTSHPHLTFSTLANYHNQLNNKEGKLFSGFDVIYFDNVFLENTAVKNAIENYQFHDWGIFEHFLISLNELAPETKLINIYEETKINKVENDRELINEPSPFLVNSHKLNSAIFGKFLEENTISREYLDLAYCHFKFELSSNKVKHYVRFSIDILKYIFRRIRASFYLAIPRKLKDFIKGKK